MGGVCVIQIKPQLVRLLELPDDCLTKEIQLTQDLMELFVEYQIPSDLLSFAGDDASFRSEKLAYVKNQVAMMQEMIKKAKLKEVEEAKVAATYNLAVPISSYQALSYDAVPEMDYMCFSACESVSNMASCAPVLDCIPVPSPPPVQAASLDSLIQEAPAPATPEAPKDNSPKEIDLQAQESESEDPNDITKIPHLLNDNIDKFDTDAALHSTIIKPSLPWTRHYQKSLLADA